VSHHTHAKLVSIRGCPAGGSSGISSGCDHGEVGTESESSEVGGAARAVEMPEGARVAMACLSAAEATRMKSVVRRRGDAPSDDRWGKEAAANAEVHHADPSDTGPSMASALHRF